MTKIVSLTSLLAAAGASGALLCAASAAQAQAVPHTPQIKFEPAAEAPVIDGLQSACISEPSDGAPSSKTCPVIHYGSTKTWIFSYHDNRTSFAVVTLDGAGKILRNIEAPGARYIFDVFSDDRGQKLTLVGQAKNSVVINWADLPH